MGTAANKTSPLKTTPQILRSPRINSQGEKSNCIFHDVGEEAQAASPSPPSSPRKPSGKSIALKLESSCEQPFSTVIEPTNEAAKGTRAEERRA